MDKSRHLYLTEFSEAVVSDLRRNVYIFSVPHICSMAVIRPGITVLSSGGWMHLKVYYSHIGSATRFDSLLFIPDKFSEVLLSSRQGESPKKDWTSHLFGVGGMKEWAFVVVNIKKYLILLMQLALKEEILDSEIFFCASRAFM